MHRYSFAAASESGFHIVAGLANALAIIRVKEERWDSLVVNLVVADCGWIAAVLSTQIR